MHTFRIRRDSDPFLFFSLLVLASALACNKKTPDATENSESPIVSPQETNDSPAKSAIEVEAKASHVPPWSLRYSDGSHNGFHFWQEAEGDAGFAYAPMTPERSSSGTYSGGEPKTGGLSKDDTEELWKRFTQLEADASLHSKTRAMGTGSFTIRRADNSETIFVITRGVALEDFEEFVKSYRGS